MLGYHPQTNGKSERFNRILEAALFRLNTLGDPNRWDAITEDLVLPGREEIKNRIEILNKTRITATKNTAERALQSKAVFDSITTFARDLDSLVVGQAVKLRNEKHTKGSPQWYGPFEISKVLDKNAYILVNHDGVKYPQPVNGNSLRPVSLRLLIVNKMWAALPAIALREKQAKANVAWGLLKKAKCLAKTRQPKKSANKAAEPIVTPPINPPGRRLHPGLLVPLASSVMYSLRG
ncbi:hypothetical protein PCANC_08217 [Puccinia coronata f. sp. avenae]|uniref:Integrase catalytic domain-containing protein n=1 Tax=Puccinia coronata f. sp. avenae TaxID=200324 RepID=A0A2N5T5T9_9BASI|nr:hypothetical protein PCANC_08217 [Puccinia coronata f. sp. avenae]